MAESVRPRLSLATSIEAVTISRPPVTDIPTYLTILESHMRPELLPTLLEILQDHGLTAEIGWDLVGLLTPLLPESRACLIEVARWGNPREVMLTLLEALGRVHPLSPPALEDADPAESAGAGSGIKDDRQRALVFEVKTLLELLCLVHPRLKTSFPSRFVSTTLQAVLGRYDDIPRLLPRPLVDEVTLSIIRLVRTLAGKKRPALPPRPSTRDVIVTARAPPDPEAGGDGQSSDQTPSSGELAIQKRLLQSFVTHVLEEYLLSFGPADEVPGVAWAARLQERVHPEKIVPHKASLTTRFTQEPSLRARQEIVSQLVFLARSLDLGPFELARKITSPPTDAGQDDDGDDDHPKSAADIPLSRTGSVFLLVEMLLSSQHVDADPPFVLFPDHQLVVELYLGPERAEISQRQPALLDAVLALGLSACDRGQFGDIGQIDYDDFHRYLQALSLLSANHPSSSLRYHAHLLCSSILHAHPTDSVRLSFVLDTLEHCPFPNLKASAVDWFKQEILSANRAQDPQEQRDTSVFASPETLESVSPLLFPDLSDTLDFADEDASKDASSENEWLSTIHTLLQTHLPFYLASLNLYFILLHDKSLHEQLDIPDTLRSESNRSVTDAFVAPLREACRVLSRHFADDGSSSSLSKTLPSLPETDKGARPSGKSTTLDEAERGQECDHPAPPSDRQEPIEHDEAQEGIASTGPPAPPSRSRHHQILPPFSLEAALARVTGQEGVLEGG